MYEDRIGRLRRSDQRRGDQVEVRRSVERVIESSSGELPAAIDQMLRGIDRVAVTVGQACRWLAGAGAGGTAAFLSRKAKVKPGAKVVTILSGGNIDFERLKGII